MDLFTPIEIGNYHLKNRIFMAPMTRCRSVRDNVANEMMAQYYAQRASAGLIISEGSQISPIGIGYRCTPGIHTKEQVQGWRKVTEAVHEKGGRIFLQLWHVGRVSHPDYHNGDLPVAPSAIRPAGEIYTYEGKKAFVTPRALLPEEPALKMRSKLDLTVSRSTGPTAISLTSSFVMQQTSERTATEAVSKRGRGSCLRSSRGSLLPSVRRGQA